MKKKGLITTCLCAALGVGLTATLASCNNGGPTKYTVSAQCDEGCSVSGISTTGYEKGELVSFKVNVTAEHKAVKDVTSAEVTITKSLDKYEFSMPEKNVDLKVTLKDSGTLAVTFNPTTVEINEVTTFTVTLDGSALPTGSEVVVKAAGDVAARVEGTNTIKGLKVGEETLTFSVKDKGYDAITAKLNVVNTKVSIKGAYEDALTTDAKKNGKYSKKAYSMKSKVVAKGNVDSSGYGDVIIADNERYAICNSLISTTYKSVEVGDEVITKGEVNNYFGLLEFKYNKDGAKTMSFEKTKTDVTPIAIEEFNATKFDEYYQKAVTASTASSSKAGNTIDDIIEIKYIKGTVKAGDFETTEETPEEYRGITFEGASHQMNFDITPDSLPGKTAIINATAGAEFEIEGYILGANTSKGRSNILLTKADLKEYTVNEVTVSSDKDTLNYGETAQLTTVVDPEQAKLQYGVSYIVSPESAVSISSDGKVTPNILNEDTHVSIKAKCSNVESETAVDILVKAAQEGDVYITTQTSKVAINGEPFAFEGGVVGHPEATLIWTSSDDAIASFNENVLTGHAEGDITVTATSSLSSSKTITIPVNIYYDLSKPIPSDIPTIKADTTYNQTHLYEIKGVSVKTVSFASYGRYTVTDGINDLVIYSSRIENPEDPSLSYKEGKWSHDYNKGFDPTPAAVIGMKLDLLVYGASKNYNAVITKYEEVHATSFTVEPSSMTLAKGQSEDIVVTTEPAVITDQIKFESSDSAIASVDSTGKVVGGNEGDAVITVTVGSLEPKVVNVHSTGVEVQYEQLVKYDFSNETITRPSGAVAEAALTTFFADASSADKTKIIPTVSNISGSIYCSKGSGGSGIPDNVLKIGKATEVASFTLSLSGDESKNVSRIILTAYSWNTNQTIKINNAKYVAATAKSKIIITLDVKNTQTFVFSVTNCFCLSDISFQYIV